MQAWKILIQRFLLSRTIFYIFFGILIGFALAIASIWLFWEFEISRKGTTVNQGLEVSELESLSFDLDNRPSIGRRDARVTVIEFTDYECPFCKRHNETVLPKLISEYKNNIRYIAVNFPLTQIHPLAFEASIAAECAFDQGRFWEYRRQLFANEGALFFEKLILLADKIDLDVNQFEKCMKSDDKYQLVKGDILIAEELGITGTPTFFINDKVLIGSRPFGSFKLLIDAELQKQYN